MEFAENLELRTSKITRIFELKHKTQDIIASQLTDISPKQDDTNSQRLSFDEILNLYKKKIVSFNGELLNKKECKLKGSRYCISIMVGNPGEKRYEVGWIVRYLKLVDIDTRDALEKILIQLRSSNSEGYGNFVSCINDPNKEEPGQIFKDGYTKYSCFEKFNELDESFQLSFTNISHGKQNYCKASMVEDIISLLLGLDELLDQEQDFKIVEGELIKNQLKISSILREDADFTNSIVQYSILKESNWGNYINYKNHFDIYLTNSRINFKIFDN